MLNILGEQKEKHIKLPKKYENAQNFDAKLPKKYEIARNFDTLNQAGGGGGGGSAPMASPHLLRHWSGVLQGTILRPVLFNWRFKSAELIANWHGLGMHSYANDMECYISFDRDSFVDWLKIKF